MIVGSLVGYFNHKEKKKEGNKMGPNTKLHIPNQGERDRKPIPHKPSRHTEQGTTC